MRAILLILLNLIVGSAVAAAQDVATVGETRNSTVCRGREDPNRCGGRMQYEFLAYYRLTGDRRLDIRYLLGITLGDTHSIGRRGGIGAKFYAAAHDGLSGGVLGLYRGWLSENDVFEIGLGTLLGGETGSLTMQVPSLVTEISFSYQGWIAVSSRVDVVRYGEVDGFTDVGVHLGAKVGGALGLVGYLVAAIGLVAAASSAGL